MPGTWEDDVVPYSKNSGSWICGILAKRTPKVNRTSKAKSFRDENYIPSPIHRGRLILSWLKVCNEEHGDHCRSTNRREQSPNDVPFWLIDVSARCIKQATPEDQYLALSYVWEDPSVRELYNVLEKGNLELLKTPGAFEAEDGIPSTVRDAIKLTARLGLRYLWVDRFCIVQDDYATKDHQIGNMASIYANAHLTIIAGVGDASAPLQGELSQNAMARTRFRSRVELLNESKWVTRAWTLQELLFSPRAVFFLKSRMVWECHCDVWEETNSLEHLAESGDVELCANRFTGASTGLQHNPWPDMDEYSRIVANYSGRSLTYEEDTIPAFSGVTNVLSESFIGGFICGLPSLFLDIALLWRPKAKIKRKRTLNQGNVLPSWSWMGWSFSVAEVDLILWRAASSYVRSSNHHKRGDERERFQSPNSTSVQPTVTWFLGPPEGQRQIENVGLQYQNMQNDPNANLPKGWYKAWRCFQHECDNQTLFNYPVPVRNRGTNNSANMPNYITLGPLLYFKTIHGHFNIKFYCRKNPRNPRKNDIAIANILDTNGDWAGHFRSHDMKLGLNSENYDGREKLEFIAISTGSERNGSHVFDMEYFRRHMDADGKVGFVNVLWIERIDGIAYRKGLGHIVKSAWDRQATEKVDVVLG